MMPATWHMVNPDQPPIIDAEAEQEKQRAPYTFRGMTIREVPIRESPCNESCEEYRRGDCITEVWACKEYSKFRSE
jgi:hypothetical protein